MPYHVARAVAAGPWFPSLARICSLEMNAWTTPESVRPSANAQKVSQNMKKASRSPCPRSTRMVDHVAAIITI